MNTNKNKGPSKVRTVLSWLLTFLVLLVAAFFVYTGIYYHTGDTAKSYMTNQKHLPVTAGDASVKVREVSDGWLFDGPGKDTAVIFYPGAKVEAQSYAPVLYMTAQEGYDCFLVKMPLRLAIFGQNRADGMINRYPSYTHWYMAGHSLGGAMAGNYAAAHKDKIDGAIFLAAYPTKSLKKDGFRALSLYGSRDGVLNQKKYKANKTLMPDDFTETVIRGGNHAQFGDYGFQSKDGKATISDKKQWKETAQDIAGFLKAA